MAVRPILSFLLVLSFMSTSIASGQDAFESGAAKKITIRSWTGHESSQQGRSSSVPLATEIDPARFSIASPEHTIDLGAPVKRFGYSPDGKETFALLDDGNTLVHLTGDLPLESVSRIQLAAPTDDFLVLRDYIILLQSGLRRLEIRPVSSPNSSLHWSPKEGDEIRGVGMSPKNLRAPLIIWLKTKDENGRQSYYFEFLDPKTFKKAPWRVEREDSGQNQNHFFDFNVDGKLEGKLAKIDVSNDGLTVKEPLFSLTFGQFSKVSLKITPNFMRTTDRERYKGEFLPFGFSGHAVFGESDNYLFLPAANYDPRMIVVLNRDTLVPIGMIMEMEGKFDQTIAKMNFLGNEAWKIELNEPGGHLHLRRSGERTVFSYKFELPKVLKTFPRQSCPVNLPLDVDEAGVMRFSFGSDWGGDGHTFRLVSAPPDTKIDESTGDITLQTPANLRPGSEMRIQAQGAHRDGFIIAFEAIISVPYKRK